MNIDDLIKHTSFDKFLTDEFERLSAGELYDSMIDLFKDEPKARDWFYTECPALGGKRPYDLCVKGDTKTVIDTVGRLANGTYV